MLKYILKKEFLLVFRNLHAVGVLFIMPMAFILIMSLALKNTYSSEVEKKLDIVFVSNQNSNAIKSITKDFQDNKFFNIKSISNTTKKDLLYENKNSFLVDIPKDVFKAIHNKDELSIKIYSKPDAQQDKLELLKNLLIKSISSIYVKNITQGQNINANFNLEEFISKHYIYKNKEFNIKPNSVQQSVPAWLVFSMFFILIPISNTFIQEKLLGTSNRIKSINVSLWPIMFGKMLPYYIINQIQVILMILVGIFIVPKLGGDSLVIQGNLFYIFIISSFISFAAISFALFISMISKTSEDATSFGGLSNIILAALGGIMVPKIVMPEFMQNITEYSPMAWGLQSFLEVFVRGGNINDFAVYLVYLFIFGIIMLGISYILLKRKNK